MGLAQALLHDPDVLILDEPTDGLDPNQKHEVRALIKAMADKKTIILSTHILEEVDAVCTRAIIIAKGRVIVDGRPEELVERAAGHNTVRLTAPQADVARIKEALERHDDVQEVREEACPLGGQGELAVRPRKGKAILSTVSALARDNGWKLGELRCDRGRLDEVFRDLTMEAGSKS